MGFPGGSDGKESACNIGDTSLISGLGRSPGEGNGYPLQYSFLENPMDRRSWQSTVHGVAKSQTQLRLILLFFFFFFTIIYYRKLKLPIPSFMGHFWESICIYNPHLWVHLQCNELTLPLQTFHFCCFLFFFFFHFYVPLERLVFIIRSWTT